MRQFERCIDCGRGRQDLLPSPAREGCRLLRWPVNFWVLASFAGATRGSVAARHSRAGVRALPRCIRYDCCVVTRAMFEAELISGTDFESSLTDFLRPPFRKFEFSTRFSPAHAARVL